jgi:hypothetical protein
MSKPDAERTLGIYRTFVKQTDQVVNYLSIARHYEHVTRLEIPKIKHAPTSLAGQLEDYVRDNDFDVMRRQYLAEQQTKKPGSAKATNGTGKLFDSSKTNSTKTDAFPEPKASQSAPAESKGPAPDLIDFFASIEQNQQPMATNTNPFQQQQFAQQQQQQQQQQPQAQAVVPSGYPHPTGFGIQTTGMAPQQQPQQPFAPQNTQGNPFLQMQQQQQQQAQQQAQQQQAQQQLQQQQQQPQQVQTNFTGAGFGGYTPQPQQQNNRFQPGLSSIPQNNVAPFQPQQPFATGSTLDSPISSNPFRQSMLPNATGTSTNSFGSASTVPTSISRQNTNPFAKSGSPAQSSPAASSSPFAPPNFSQQPPAQPLMPTATGTNPFARAAAPTSSPFSTPALSANPTGSTNPFRQSQFVNQQTGQGWQTGPQGTIGGVNPEQVATMPIFPRPGQPNSQPQQTGWPAM